MRMPRCRLSEECKERPGNAKQKPAEFRRFYKELPEGSAAKSVSGLGVFEQRGRQIAFARVGEDHDERLSLRDSGRAAYLRAAAMAAPQLMPEMIPSSFARRGAISNDSSSVTGHDFIDELHVEDVGNEAGAQALDAVLARACRRRGRGCWPARRRPI